MEVLVHFIIFLHQGIAEAKTGLGDEDVKTTAVNLVMVSTKSVYLLKITRFVWLQYSQHTVTSL